MQSNEHFSRLKKFIPASEMNRFIHGWTDFQIFTKWAPSSTQFLRSPRNVSLKECRPILQGLLGSCEIEILSHASLPERNPITTTNEEYARSILQGRPLEKSSADQQPLCCQNYSGSNEEFARALTACVEEANVEDMFDIRFPQFTSLYEGIDDFTEAIQHVGVGPAKVVKASFASATYLLTKEDSMSAACLDILRLCKQAVPIGVFGGKCMLLTA